MEELVLRGGCVLLELVLFRRDVIADTACEWFALRAVSRASTKVIMSFIVLV